MPTRTCTLTLLALMFLLAGTNPSTFSQNQRRDNHGPEVESFLEYCRHEDNELDFQIRHNEIGRKEYQRSKNRIAVHREAVLKIVRESQADVVPELHVVTEDEVDALIEDGTRLLKTLKPGAMVNEKWRYVTRAVRGETFYIFERLGRI